MGLAGGCDTGYAVLEPNGGPPPRVVSTYPEDLAGFDCAVDDLACGVPIDTSIEVRFDRFLLPSTAVRQSLTIYSGDDPGNVVPPNEGAGLTPRYDVVERVVTYDLPPGVLFAPNTIYTVKLHVPLYADDFGFRAFDGVPLDPDTTTEIQFLTSNQPENRPPDDPSATCDEVIATFNVGCLSKGCHGVASHMMGLNLSTADDLARTAIGRVAHEAETGPNTGRPTENPTRFGVAMPRIDPGRPENSYLVYKLLAAPENYRQTANNPDLCGTSHRAAVDPVACVPASTEEIGRLRDWFLRGVAMPRLKAPGEDQPPEGVPDWLFRSELLGIQSWILSGAACP